MLEQHMKEEKISIEDILDSIKVGIYLTDGTGKTLMVNSECCKNGGMTKEELIGKDMKELMELGYVRESDSLRVMQSGKEESFVQNLGEGGRIFITGAPVYKNGKIALIVSTERDVTETMKLRMLLNKKEEEEEQYRSEIEFLRQNMMDATGIVAASPLMKRLLERAGKAAKVDTTILLQGESGTGKEVFADYIYQYGNRNGKPFIKLNCGAIPETLIESELFGYEKDAFTGANKSKIGIFEEADGGTIFLDEIGDIPLHLQVKLLRVLQEKEIRRVGGNRTIPVDVRIIAATNVDLKSAIKVGTFREDLFYRLNILTLSIPPLRNHREDIHILATAFVRQFNEKYGMTKALTAEAITALEDYEWPGNIRELRNMIERIMINIEGNLITKFQILKQIGSNTFSHFAQESEESLSDRLKKYEKDLLMQALAEAGNASEAAKKLRIDKSTMSRKLKMHNIL